MKIEGRVFALTGPQMVELIEFCKAAVSYYDRNITGRLSATVAARTQRDRAIYWAEYLRREHAAHFGEDGDSE